jgi:hypothetical protein
MREGIEADANYANERELMKERRKKNQPRMDTDEHRYGKDLPDKEATKCEIEEQPEFLRIDREFVCANVRQTLQNKYKDILWTMTK